MDNLYDKKGLKDALWTLYESNLDKDLFELFRQCTAETIIKKEKVIKLIAEITDSKGFEEKLRKKLEEKIDEFLIDVEIEDLIDNQVIIKFLKRQLILKIAS